MYVSDAGIWTYPGAEEIKLALAALADDHRSLIDRAGAALEDRGLEVPRHPYPIQFTATHDLDLRALLPRVITGLKAQIAALEKTAVSADDSEAADLVGEAITSIRTHLDVLNQLVARPHVPTG